MFRIALISLLALVASLPAAAEQYPDRQVIMLGGYPAGGQVDVVARILAEAMKSK